MNPREYANEHEISEHAVFVRAHEGYYGRPDEARVAQDFGRWLWEERTPVYVNWLMRQGGLDR